MPRTDLIERVRPVLGPRNERHRPGRRGGEHLPGARGGVFAPRITDVAGCGGARAGARHVGDVPAAGFRGAEQATLRRALEQQAEDVERDRLARVVHDGVLQALAFIHRRGVDAGGEAARLGAMAGEQEQRLRALVSGVSIEELEATVGGPVDLRTFLRQAVAGTADLVAPADPVFLPRRPAAEMVAAVEAALDNVRRHAGRDAHAWVLIDDAGDDIVVTVRDNGGVSRSSAGRRATFTVRAGAPLWRCGYPRQACDR